MDQQDLFEFSDTLFLRAPFFSIDDYAMSNLSKLLAMPEFRNALWLASPDFFQVLEKADFNWDVLGKKEQLSLSKYYNRMAHRATPFGAFASFSLVPWNEIDQVRLVEPKKAVLHILPSREWQEHKQAQLKSTMPQFDIRANFTIMRFGDSLSFIRSRRDTGGKTHFFINRIAAEELNIRLLEWAASKVLPRLQVAATIQELTACTLAEAEEYVDFLLQEQVFISEFEGSLIGMGYCGADPIWKQLKDVAFDHNLDLPGFRDELSKVDNTEPFKENALYAGLERPVQAGGISAVWQSEILATTNLLRKIVIPYPTPALTTFIKAFKIRFADRKVNLLEAIDPDRGIGYAGLHTGASKSDLLKDIAFPDNTVTKKSIDWTPVHRLFFRLWLKNTERSLFDPIRLSEQDAASLELSDREISMPPSIAFLFSRSSGELVLENNGGASGTALIGRFSLFSKEVEMLCRNLAQQEALANPNVLFAELHQLSDAHTDNINRRMSVYDYVIPINTFDPNAIQKTIELQDLQLYMAGEELIMERISDQKRVIPRLPTAYNYQHTRLPLFQFLADLQHHRIQANLTFDLEKLFPALDFYPRVTFRKTVICLAKWRVSETEIDSFRAEDISLGKLHQWRQQRGLPSLVAMGLSDQQLVFDLTKDRQAMFFLDILKEFKTVTIREHLEPDRSVTAGKNRLAGQLIALLIKKKETYRHIRWNHPAGEAIQRRFLPGSSCLYLKIYCNPEMADSVLLDLIAPFLNANQSKVKSWFFIRYHDPESHIRLRLFINPKNYGQLMKGLYQVLIGNSSAIAIHDVKQDIYEREVERYSNEMMKTAESVFSSGSQLALSWLLYRRPASAVAFDSSVFGLVFHMSGFFIDAPLLRMEYFKKRSESFIREFGDQKNFRKDLARKYRVLSGSIESVIGEKRSAEMIFLADPSTSQFLDTVNLAAQKSIFWTEERRLILLGDLIHMQVNRMFSHMQRQHEALIYYCLFKMSYGLLRKNSA